MKIRLNKMIFFGYHGVHPAEQELGQRFVVSLEMETDHEKDSSIKHLKDTVDYSKVYSEISDIMQNNKFVLLENCANEIINVLLKKHSKLEKITVNIQKPSVPIKGILESAEIEISRER